MRIIHIQGPANSGKSALANSMRNNQITQGEGALMIDDTQNGEPRYLLEKIIVAEPLVPGTPAGDIPWKPGSLVIVVNDKIAVLDEFEALAPGFLDLFGPVRVLSIA